MTTIGSNKSILRDVRCRECGLPIEECNRRALERLGLDPDEVPELTEEHFRRAAIYDGETLIRRKPR